MGYLLFAVLSVVSAASALVPRKHTTNPCSTSFRVYTALVFRRVEQLPEQSHLGCALDIPRHRPCSDYAEIWSVGYPGVADRDQYWGIGAFNNRGIVPLNKGLQDVYANVREKTEFSRNHPGFENCLRPVSRIDNQSSAKDSRYKEIWRCVFGSSKGRIQGRQS